MGVFPNPNSLRMFIVSCERVFISLPEENCLSTILRLESEIIRHTGKRDTRKNLGIAIPYEILLIKARHTAESKGRTGISPTYAKLCLKEIKMIGRMPAINTRNISGNSFECFSVKIIDRFMMDHRISNIPQKRIVAADIFSPRCIKRIFLK